MRVFWIVTAESFEVAFFRADKDVVVLVEEHTENFGWYVESRGENNSNCKSSQHSFSKWS